MTRPPTFAKVTKERDKLGAYRLAKRGLGNPGRPESKIGSSPGQKGKRSQESEKVTCKKDIASGKGPSSSQGTSKESPACGITERKKIPEEEIISTFKHFFRKKNINALHAVAKFFQHGNWQKLTSRREKRGKSNGCDGEGETRKKTIVP